MTPEERDRALADRRKAYMEGDFNPPYSPSHTPPPEARIASAAEYAAYQLGQINRSLKEIVRLLEQKT